MTKTRVIVCLLLIFLGPMPFSAECDAFVGPLVKWLGKELPEMVGRGFGRKAAQESLEVGAEKSAELVLRYGAKGRRALSLVGDDAVRMAERYGQAGIEMLASRSGSEARRLVAGSEQAIVFWRRFGKEGTDLWLRHPGLSTELLAACGKHTVAVANRLSSRNLARLSYFRNKISRENLDAMITWVLAKGDEVMEFCWRHKGKIIAGAAVHSLLKTNDQGFNYLHHALNKIIDNTHSSFPWLVPAVALLGALALVPRLGRFFALFGAGSGRVGAALVKAAGWLKPFVLQIGRRAAWLLRYCTSMIRNVSRG